MKNAPGRYMKLFIISGLTAVIFLFQGSVKGQDDPTFDSSAQWSPTGEWIAFSSNRGGNSDIWLVHPDGSEMTNLTDSPYLDFDAHWSPDGQYISFRSNRGGNNDFDVWVISLDKNTLVNVTEWNSDLDTYHEWSPNGEWIATISNHSFTGNDIWIIRPDGSDATNLTDDTSLAFHKLAWSPDSNRIATIEMEYLRFTRISVISFKSSQTHEITQQRIALIEGNFQHLEWSPVAELMTAEPAGEIRLVNTLTGESYNISEEITDGDMMSSWSLSGKQVAFVSHRSGRSDIWVVNADGSNRINLTNSPDYREILPNWSPDGKYIVFDRSESLYSASLLWIIGADGEEIKQLTFEEE